MGESLEHELNDVISVEMQLKKSDQTSMFYLYLPGGLHFILVAWTDVGKLLPDNERLFLPKDDDQLSLSRPTSTAFFVLYHHEDQLDPIGKQTIPRLTQKLA